MLALLIASIRWAADLGTEKSGGTQSRVGLRSGESGTVLCHSLGFSALWLPRSDMNYEFL